MKYTQEITDKLKEDYLTLNRPVEEIAQDLDIPKRSVIAKLSSLGIYKKKPYVDKTGRPPIKKSTFIEILSTRLRIPVEQLDSLEKVNKRILETLVASVPDPKLNRAMQDDQLWS